MREKNTELLRHITGPLADLGTPDAALARRARTYFAAVHGIVAFSLQERFVACRAKNCSPNSTVSWMGWSIRRAAAWVEGLKPDL